MTTLGLLPRSMVSPLECQELVDRLDHFWILRLEPELAAAREWLVNDAKLGAFSRDRRGTGHLSPMHVCGRAEVPLHERMRDRLQMLAYGRGARRVVFQALQLDATAVGQRLEAVLRSVLIHAHCDLAAGLEGGERGVALRVRSVGRVVRRRLRGHW